MDFSLKRYREFLGVIDHLELPVYSIREWISSKPSVGVFIRHDVDRLPKNALRMAKIEADMDIYTTYYFRIGAHTFKPDIITSIHELGHEVGYHYEDLSLARGNFPKAISLFERHLNELRTYVPIDTIAMHGRPLSSYDNRNLWECYDIADFNLLGEAFLTIDYSNVHYFTDTGRNWSDFAPNLRDNVNTQRQNEVRSTVDLMDFVRKNPNSKIGIVAHPERWNDHLVMWTAYSAFDLSVNLAKKLIRFAYPRR